MISRGPAHAPLLAASATILVKSGPGISALDRARVKDVLAIPAMANNESSTCDFLFF